MTKSYFAALLLSTLLIIMEPINFGYSTKNIPVAKLEVYMKCSIEKTFLQRMRWKASHFLHPATDSSTKETFGFKTTKSPPPVKELMEFEEKLLKLTQSIHFKNNSCEFQSQLSPDANKIRKDKNMIIAADKTANFSRMDTKSYKQLREANTTKSYMKAPPNSVQNII